MLIGPVSWAESMDHAQRSARTATAARGSGYRSQTISPGSPLITVTSPKHTEKINARSGVAARGGPPPSAVAAGNSWPPP